MQVFVEYLPSGFLIVLIQDDSLLARGTGLLRYPGIPQP